MKSILFTPKLLHAFVVKKTTQKYVPDSVANEEASGKTLRG